MSKGNAIICGRDICTPVYMAALLAIARGGNNSIVHLQKIGKKHATYIQWGTSQSSRIKHCNNVGGTRDCYTK